MNRNYFIGLFTAVIVLIMPTVSITSTFSVINRTGKEIRCKVAAGDANTFSIKKILFNGTIKANASQWVDSGLASKIIVIAMYNNNEQILEASTPLSPSDRIKVGRKYIIYGKGVCEQNITSNDSDVRPRFSTNYERFFYNF